jgi:glycosyltransferase involved in cell wall biosynthesis
LKSIPQKSEVNGIPVYYSRYTSPPKQIFHGTWGFFAYLFLRRRLKALHQQYNFDLIHAHYASPCGVIALLARRWMHVPVVLSIHGSDITYTVRQNPLGAAIIRWVFRNTDAIIANSTWTKEQIVHYGGDPERVQIVRLGGNSPKAISLTKSTAEKDAIILLSVGYLEKRKGHAFMLQAIKHLRDEGYNLRYVIVGDGTLRQFLQNMANTLGIEDIVFFEGYKPHSEVWSYFTQCDIFALPSWDEAFGVVYIEALGQGKPVIGCEGEGGPEDLKTLGDCIELVKPRDIESLTQALKRLIDDPDRRRQMGETGRKIVTEHFTWEQNAADTWAIYQQVLKANNA